MACRDAEALARTLHQLAVLASHHHHDDWAGAEALLAESQALWQTSFGTLGRADLSCVRRVRVLVAAQVDAARAEALWAEGVSLDVVQAVVVVLNN